MENTAPKKHNWKIPSRDGLDLHLHGWVPPRRVKGVVCLLHGFGEHSGRYAGFASALAEKGYALLGLDLRGHGRSQGLRGHSPSLGAYFDDIDLLLAQAAARFPLVPRFIYGHSLGGILALVYAPLRRPQIAGVVAAGPGIENALMRQKGKMALVRSFGRFFPRLYIESGLDPRLLSRNPDVMRANRNDLLLNNKMTLGFGRVSLKAIRLALKNARRFPVPVLVMHGSGDRLGFPEGSKRFAIRAEKNCTFKLWDGFYHELHNEPGREEVFSAVTDWLDRHAAPLDPRGRGAAQDKQRS